jgi:ribosomal protein S14
MGDLTPRQRSFLAHRRRVAEADREFTFQEHVGDLAGLGLVDAVWSNAVGKAYHVECRAQAPDVCTELAADVNQACGGCGGRLGIGPLRPKSLPLGTNRCWTCGKVSKVYECFPWCRHCVEPACPECDVPSARDEESGRTSCRFCEAEPPIGHALPEPFGEAARPMLRGLRQIWS